uniref:Ribosomal protein L34 n=1 Tax=Callithamnion tetricum TaxID=193179 RepID=A0A4D6WQR8_9FLOR|nr:ribosomal protein L34 [Callithamnion tetricum]
MTKGTLLKKRRKSGFRSRIKTKAGQKILRARRTKKRKLIVI